MQHILARGDPHFSWALWASAVAGMPVNALVGLRVRLCHLPCLVALPADAYVQQSHAAGLLDASVTVLDSIGLGAAAQARLAQAGSRHGISRRIASNSGPRGYRSNQALELAAAGEAEHRGSKRICAKTWRRCKQLLREAVPNKRRDEQHSKAMLPSATKGFTREFTLTTPAARHAQHRHHNRKRLRGIEAIRQNTPSQTLHEAENLSIWFVHTKLSL